MNEIKVLDRPEENESGPFSPTKLRARRTLKIENLGDTWRGNLFAGIRLKGRWLASAGFHPGGRVAVIVVSPGVMQLRVVREEPTKPQSESTPSPDLNVVFDGSIALLYPLTDLAREWLRVHCPAGNDHQYFCGALVVEARYVADLLAHAIEDGLKF